jgi:hypothetical protein
MVGMVVTISPSFSLYRMVVLPAASRPTCRVLQRQTPKPLMKYLINATQGTLTMRMRISFLEKSLENNLVRDNPILTLPPTGAPVNHLPRQCSLTFLPPAAG